ncbi:Aromatic/aminoadipate aminotransferase 1 [Collariella sp. IMI 366227]|nr:Aromatic/aminoadipate aminotransferase 1 [Collariella sp. IMI 366227]
MRSAIRNGALRGLPLTTTGGPGPLHPGLTNGIRGNNTTGQRRPSTPSASSNGFHSKSRDCSSEAVAPAAKLPDADPVPPVTPCERVTLDDIKERRAKAGRLVAPTAAYSDADMFKAPSKGKPKAKRWDPAKHLKTPGLISLGGDGSAQMTRFVTEHTELVGAPPYEDWRVCLTAGSTAALEQTLRMFCDGRGRGDSLLTEEFSFSTALETAGPLGVKVVGVKMDGEGVVPGVMDEILSGWDVKARGGQEAACTVYRAERAESDGATQSEERRREIYEVARRHDVFIVEDEPYYYLQMQDEGREAPGGVEEFLEGLIPTYLSMDVDGRVLRMDSFSKVVVPGSRMGWITASEQIVERFIRHAEVCNQGPSGFSQVILHKLLDEQWGHEGYLGWLMNLRMEYTKRRDVMAGACEEFLPREVVSWNSPKAGMVDHEKHPHASTKSILEIEEEIFNSCISKGVLVARGSWFRAEQDVPPSALFFRATFAAATPENMREAIRRLGKAIRESFKL